MATVCVDTPDRRARRALVEALALAFRDNPMNRTIHGPSARRRVRANRAGLRALVLDLHAWTETRVIRNEGRVVGGFIAVPPGAFPLPEASLWRQLGCLFHQGARAMERWGFVTESLYRVHPLAPHWYLAVLGVCPAFQRRGYGSLLLTELEALVAGDSHSIYLESDRASSVAFYRTRGFEIEGELRLLEVPCWRLRRPTSLGLSGEGTDLCNAVDRRSALEDKPPAVVARRTARSEVAP